MALGHTEWREGQSLQIMDTTDSIQMVFNHTEYVSLTPNIGHYRQRTAGL